MYAQYIHNPFRSCFTCEHYGKALDAGRTVWCVKPGWEHARAQPESGCAFWSREPGTDDDIPARIREMMAEGRPLA